MLVTVQHTPHNYVSSPVPSDIDYFLHLLPPILIWTSVGFFYIRFFVGGLGFSITNGQHAEITTPTSTGDNMTTSSSPRDLQLYFFGLGGIHVLLLFPYFWIHNQAGLGLEVQIWIASCFFIAALPIRSLVKKFQIRILLAANFRTLIFFLFRRLTLSLTIFVFLFYLLSLYLSAPIEGWDSLTYWCKRALILMGQSAHTDGSYYTALARHPDLNAAALAWSSSSQASSEISTAKLPWILAGISTGFICYGFVAHLTKDRRVGAVAALACLTQPLFENHIGLAGYAEVWVMCAMLGATTFFALALEERSFIFVVCAITCSVICMYTKNTWPVYAIPMALSAGFSYLYMAIPTSKKASFLQGIGFLLVLLIILMPILQLVLLFDTRGFFEDFISLINSFNFLGYVLNIEIRDPLSAFSGLPQVFFLNQSFSVAGILFLITLYVAVWCSPAPNISPTNLFLVMFCSLFLLEILVGLLLFPRLYEAALPGEDTSFSRLMLPFGVFAVVTASVIFEQRQNVYPSACPHLRHR